MEGVDYAWARPSPAVMWRLGKRFVSRYLAYLPNGKVLSRSELVALHSQGFGVMLNWEQSSGDMLKGRATGVAHAQEALRQANALGAPSSVPIYFSCDVDTNVISRTAVADYLDGCASVLGRQRVGVYGEVDVIDGLVPNHAAWGWQTYAWSNGRMSPKAHVYQYKNGVRIDGQDCDLNRSLTPYFGAWWPNTAEVTDVITPQDAEAIAHAVWTHALKQGTDGYAGQQAETALAFAWQAANQTLDKLGSIGAIQGLSDADRAAIQGLTDAVTTLNNRLATP